MSEPSKTPLYQSHLDCGARMVDFAGYLMPVQYKSIIAETKAVRQGAGMFDVSHMARLHLTGDRVVEYLEWITTNDISKLENDRGQYSILPNATGGAVDDIIVYRETPTSFRMVANAANHAKDVAHMKEQNSFGVGIKDNTDATAMIAVQGPKAALILAGMSDAPEQMTDAPMFGIVRCHIAGIECFCMRSGYTGEDGYEVVCQEADSARLWNALLTASVEPCGLGSRDILRVEAGLPLYGHELSDDRSPLEASLGWVVSKTKSFLGSEFFAEVRKNKPKNKLMGISLDSKRVADPGTPVIVNSVEIGQITSGVYSPTLDRGLAFAFLTAGQAVEGECFVPIRGRDEGARIMNKRFLK